MLSGASISHLPQLQTAAWSTKYHVVTIDLPGHGSRVGEVLSLDSSVEAVQILDFLISFSSQITNAIKNFSTTGKAFVAGISMGGYIAISFSRLYPNLCAGSNA